MLPGLKPTMSFSHVVVPTTPLAVRPFAAWNVLTCLDGRRPEDAIDRDRDVVRAEEALDRADIGAAVAEALGREVSP